MAEPKENGKQEGDAPMLDSEAPVFPAHWKKKAPHLMKAKYSSTSSLFLDSTISKPKTPELVLCVAEYFVHNMKDTSDCTPELRKMFDVFDETIHPLVTKVLECKKPETVIVEKYVKNIYKVGQLAPEALIMGVAYIERIVQNTPFRLYPFNWKRILLCSMILASKVWEDQAVWNVDFIETFPLTTPNDLGQMEKKILGLLGFDVALRASEYAKCYFELRARSSLNGEHFSELRPLDKEGESKLELRTTAFTAKHYNKKLYRSSGSVEDISTKIKSPRAIIN